MARDWLGFPDVHWIRPGLLTLALVLPLLVALSVALRVRRGRRAARDWGDIELVRRLGGARLGRVPWTRAVCVAGAAVALGLAAAGPGWGRAEPSGPAPARDVVLVLDASNSMLAEDVRPNRLEQERAAAEELLRELRGDRIGLVVFAGRAYVVAPLTRDHRAVQLYVDALAPSVVAQGGSSLEAALRQAAGLLTAARAGRTIVVASDGEALEERDEVLAVARQLGRAGITIHTLGIGTAGGAPVPDLDPVTGARRGSKTEPDGRTAISRRDEDLLREIADLTDGSYHALPPNASGVPRELLAAIRATPGDPRGTGSGPGRRPDQYAWFVGAALLLLGAEVAAAERERT